MGRPPRNDIFAPSPHRPILPPPRPPLVRGVMDILYRTPEGKLIIGDYKTKVSSLEFLVSSSEDQTQNSKPETRNQKLETRNLKPAYAAQGAAYVEAIRRTLGEEAAFKIIPLE